MAKAERAHVGSYGPPCRRPTQKRARPSTRAAAMKMLEAVRARLPRRVRALMRGDRTEPLSPF